MSINSLDSISNLNQERTLKNLTVNTAALLCYLGGWISGIIFLVLEQKNRFIRFHALQSIFAFGILSVAGSIVGHFPDVGQWLAGAISVAGFILWIVMMVKAGQGEFFKLPWVGDLCERLARDSMPQPPPFASPVKEEFVVPEMPSLAAVPPSPLVPPPAAGVAQDPVPPQPAAAPPPNAYQSAPAVEVWPSAGHNRQDRAANSNHFKARYYSFGARTGRIVGSSFVIAWSIALIIFFNFFHQYIAFYQANTSGGTTVWEVYPLVTGAFGNWLPILNVTLILTIIAHAFFIAYDKYIVRESTKLFLDVFSIATIVSLVSIFPFDFSPIPNTAVVQGLEIGLPVVLILSAIGTGIGVLVKFIMLIVHLAQNKY
jgi:uncharacterized membrane protein